VPAIVVPTAVQRLLDRLRSSGHAAYVVGGSLRDLLMDRTPADWDLTTDARPERLLELFPGAVYENRFGTVAVREGDQVVEVTTFRSDHDYADHRRPHRVDFGDQVEADLARRDFTINAIAFGGPGDPSPAVLVDPFEGRADLDRRCIRAVGDPDARFHEDALRIVRGIRLAATLGFQLDPETRAAMARTAPLAAHLSGERIAAELLKLLAAPVPSVGLGLLAETGVLAAILPELAAQPGVPQDKIAGEDLWAHTLRTVDAAPADQPIVRLAALLHDIGKPDTMAEGHFHGHEEAGASIAAALLVRLRIPRSAAERIVHLVRNHMFTYEPAWGDAGVRRFIRRVGRPALDELFLLREADNVGSGMPADSHGLAELRLRVAAELAAEIALERGDLAVDGNDLMAELGLPPGPTLGRILEELLERVLTDPSLNDRPTLLLLARSLAPEEVA
jgi:tRNA nucleotidyltransferase (CCA-adding enzyme)